MFCSLWSVGRLGRSRRCLPRFTGAAPALCRWSTPIAVRRTIPALLCTPLSPFSFAPFFPLPIWAFYGFVFVCDSKKVEKQQLLQHHQQTDLHLQEGTSVSLCSHPCRAPGGRPCLRALEPTEPKTSGIRWHECVSTNIHMGFLNIFGSP